MLPADSGPVYNHPLVRASREASTRFEAPSLAIASERSSRFSIFMSPKLVMMSPALRPACSAGEPSEVPLMRTPLGGASLELTAEDVSALEAASSAVQIEGERYPATHAKLIDR